MVGAMGGAVGEHTGVEPPGDVGAQKEAVIYDMIEVLPAPRDNPASESEEETEDEESESETGTESGRD
jgi:hypothetical protein